MATLHDINTIAGRAIRCGYNVMLRSQPALGKTWAINKLAASMQAEDPEFYYAYLDGGTLTPPDVVMAIPDMAEMLIRKLVDGTFPNYYKTPDARGIIYIGEWMLMGLEVNKGMQKLINHEDVGGGFRLAPGVIIFADGNRLKDKSGAQIQSRAVMSRFETWELEYDTDYALSVMQTYHERVGAFALRNPQEIDNYTDVFENKERNENDVTYQEGKQGIWASLRSWDRVSVKMRDADSTGIVLIPGEVSRNVGSGMATKFAAFNQMIDNLATLEQIIAEPKKVPVPVRMDERYALATMLALLVKRDNWEAIATYMQRFPEELQACYFKLMNDRLLKANDANWSAIRASTTYKKWITSPHIQKLLYGAV
jgi:hypothetical protein